MKWIRSALEPSFSYWDLFIIAVSIDVVTEKTNILVGIGFMVTFILAGYFVRERIS